MAWFALIFAGLLETFGVAMINRLSVKRDWQTVTLLILGFGSSLALLSYSLQFISMGTGYAIWAGIGVVGGALVGMIFFAESKDWRRIVFIAIILSSAIGLKLVGYF
ncbi:QacE family quaternary ammonium compound efflux SMR transporter [Sporosarcina sp. P12(2017)]|uniref:DMT family transporter n=1 Tax=unclassified Sporosarcina TaxID=2647733 RepID=UPI000C16719D|nr:MULTISPECIES: SMR family transporter [unclassified Sporosarcina]PIC57326.1 QacE family quaternary ammonium compound efflux SMR transporter [Sporosarcina sp. P10]PIC60708.1 QacE family quaternary ammonium compound efflux SMR transporter [Sporosarcina sp. P12(2017)]